MQLFSTLYEIDEFNKADKLFKRAFFEAENISDEMCQATTMLYIAERLVAAGSIDDALRVFDSAWYAIPHKCDIEEEEKEDDDSKQTSSEWILKELYKVFGLSCSDYSCPNKKYWDNEVRVRVIETLLDSGHVRWAFKIANQIEGDTRPFYTLIQIGLSLAIDETEIVSTFNADEKRIAAAIAKAFIDE